MGTHHFDHQEAKDRSDLEGEVKEHVEKDLRLLVTSQKCVLGTKTARGNGEKRIIKRPQRERTVGCHQQLQALEGGKKRTVIVGLMASVLKWELG